MDFLHSLVRRSMDTLLLSQKVLLNLSLGLACSVLMSCASRMPDDRSPEASAAERTAKSTTVPSASPKHEYVDALLPYEPLAKCYPTGRQLKLAEAATIAIELADFNVLDLAIGAEKYLALQPCLGLDTLRRVQIAWERKDSAFRKPHRLVEYELELASRLPDPNDDIVQVVADSAFNAQPQASQFLPYWDIRPFARAILARHFGSRIRRYGEAAYREISSDNSLGTGAAQVAAAAGYPGALDRIANLMDAALEQYPRGGTTMPHERYKRLVELLWSFEVAGPDGREYLKKYCEALERYWWRGAANGSPRCLAAQWQLRENAAADKEEAPK